MLTGIKDGVAVHQKPDTWLKRALRIEWLGQTIASIFWISSVCVYGVTAIGDWLQLFAATAWFVANLAVLAKTPSHDASIRL